MTMPYTQEYVCPTLDVLHQYAISFGHKVGLMKKPPFCALWGEMGMGKTSFAQGFIQGYTGGRVMIKNVTSPTFPVIQIYEGGRFPIIHSDFYRLETWRDIQAIGFEDYMDGHHLCLCEWSDRMEDMLPEQRIDIFFSLREQGRKIEVKGRVSA